MNSERHPIQDSSGLSMDARIRHLEVYLARLWDHVWWISLPPEVRAQYESEGFTAPIEHFYEER